MPPNTMAKTHREHTLTQTNRHSLMHTHLHGALNSVFEFLAAMPPSTKAERHTWHTHILTHKRQDTKVL